MGEQTKNTKVNKINLSQTYHNKKILREIIKYKTKMFIDNFVPSIDETELKDGTMKLVTAAGKHILLARIGDDIFGISHICPCMQCDLAQGKLEGYIVICPCHGWKFDVRTGVYLKTKQKLLKTYRCKIENGKIHIEIF